MWKGIYRQGLTKGETIPPPSTRCVEPRLFSSQCGRSAYRHLDLERGCTWRVTLPLPPLVGKGVVDGKPGFGELLQKGSQEDSCNHVQYVFVLNALGLSVFFWFVVRGHIFTH